VTVTRTPPVTHRYLLDRPLPAVLTTEMRDGRLQSTVVWFDRDGDDLLINTMGEFQKARNLRARPRATMLVADADGRWIEVRADVVTDGQDATAHLDAVSRRYTGLAPYFGRVVPAHLRETEHPVVFRLIPTVVHAGPTGLPVPRPTTPAPWSAGEPRPCADEPRIPASHRDLLGAPVTVALSTRMPDGRAQTQPVWCSVDDNDVLVNTVGERRKARNLRADPRATVLAVDPGDSGRWIEIRGDVDLVERGALAHLDALTAAYTPHPRFYGGVYPEERRHRETRVVARIHPRHIVCDAVHR
jgi:PPOX class probable F420-dependent enzyme